MDGEKTAETKELTAKTISKFFKFLSAGGIITCAVMKWAGILPNAGAGEICMIWAAVYGMARGRLT